MRNSFKNLHLSVIIVTRVTRRVSDGPDHGFCHCFKADFDRHLYRIHNRFGHAEDNASFLSTPRIPFPLAAFMALAPHAPSFPMPVNTKARGVVRRKPLLLIQTGHLPRVSCRVFWGCVSRTTCRLRAPVPFQLQVAPCRGNICSTRDDRFIAYCLLDRQSTESVKSFCQ